MPMNPGDIEDLIKEGIPDAKVTIRDLAGDGDHYAAEVVAEQLSRQEPRPAAPDGLSGAEGQYGRRAACAGAADQRAGLSPDPTSYPWERT
jgi:hypothetical protein